MAQIPMMRELQPFEKPGRRGKAAETAWYRLVAIITNPN